MISRRWWHGNPRHRGAIGREGPIITAQRPRPPRGPLPDFTILESTDYSLRGGACVGGTGGVAPGGAGGGRGWLKKVGRRLDVTLGGVSLSSCR